MHGEKLLNYLRELCRDLDSGRALKRFDWRRAAASLSFPLVLGAASLGCDGLSCIASEPGDLYGAPAPALPSPPDDPSPIANEPVQMYGVPLPPQPPPANQVAPPAVGAYGAPPAGLTGPSEPSPKPDSPPQGTLQ